MIPGPVAWLVLAASSDTARLKWTPVAGASSYSVRVEDISRPESRRWNSVCPGEAAYTCRTGPLTEGDLPVAPGHRYRAVVRALGADGSAGLPVEGTFVAADAPPGPPLLRRPRIQDLRDRALSEAAAVRGLAPALAKLAQSYSGVLSPLRLRSQRRLLNAVARYRLERLSLLEDEGRKVKEEEAVLQAQEILVAARGAPPGGEGLLAEGMEAWVSYNKVLAPIQEQGRAIAFWTLLEEKAWTEAVNRAEKSALAWVGAALLAALAAVGRLVLREARRTDRKILETANDLARRYVAALGWRPDQPPASGAVVAGNYRIVRELLPDAFATAYEAQDLTSGRPVVLRRLSAPPAVGRQADALLDSARRAAALSHPRLEPIQLVFLERGALYWVCPGGEWRRLADILGAGPRPLGEVKSLFSQLADAVDAAREAGLAHGCLGPTAVLLDAEGSARIAGMGLAPFARRTWSAEEQAYRAPETAKAAPGWESDVFSLGVLFYRLCTGRLPYCGPDVQLQQLQQAYSPPTQLAALPKEADYIVRGALQPDPRHRFPSATAMFEIIVNFPG